MVDVHWLKKAELFEALNESQLNRLLSRSTVKSFPEGTILFRQGEKANRFYVLIKGLVELTVKTQVKGDRVLVAIKDTGCGISEEIKPRLFKAFSGSKGGRHQGVGLYIAHKLLTPYGGSFQYSSRKGETTFEVSFPVPLAASR